MVGGSSCQSSAFPSGNLGSRDLSNQREPHKRHDDEYDKLLSLIRTCGNLSMGDMTEETVSRSGRDDMVRAYDRILGFGNDGIFVER